MIVWFTGNSGAGKSTLARTVKTERFPNAVWLDGDALRRTISLDKGFSAKDRREHNLSSARLADMLSRQGHLVLVSIIAPYTALREELTALCDPAWIYVKREMALDAERPYEVPEDYFTVNNTWYGSDYSSDRLTAAARGCWEYILKQADTRGVIVS